MLGFLLSGTVFACQYNVRDIGFVDLDQSTARLTVFLEDAQPDLCVSLRALLDEAMYETNVSGALVLPASEVPAITTPAHLPAAVLVSPAGQSLVIPLDIPDKSLVQTLSELTTQWIRSPVKTDLLVQAAGHFAVVLLIESDDAQKNRQAALAVETALMHVTQQMAFMPKRIESPPVLVRLTAEEAVQNDLLLWELGVTPDSAPAAAILYGRLRRMGPVLFREDITEETLTAYLGVIGADCECDLDRRLLHTPMLSHHWPRSLYESVTEGLGFDPEHPEVKMEISQIITAHGSAATGDLQIPNVTFGYQEFMIEDLPPVSTESGDAHLAAVDHKRPEGRVPPLAVQITPSGKWPLYSLLVLAGAVLVTGIIIARRRT